MVAPMASMPATTTTMVEVGGMTGSKSAGTLSVLPLAPSASTSTYSAELSRNNLSTSVGAGPPTLASASRRTTNTGPGRRSRFASTPRIESTTGGSIWSTLILVVVVMTTRCPALLSSRPRPSMRVLLPPAPTKATSSRAASPRRSAHDSLTNGSTTSSPLPEPHRRRIETCRRSRSKPPGPRVGQYRRS